MRVRFGRRSFALPGNRLVRLGMGGSLVLFGSFGFLPLLGFWMIPVGLLILSVDLPAVRRFNRRMTVRIMRAWYRWRGKASPGSEVAP